MRLPLCIVAERGWFMVWVNLPPPGANHAVWGFSNVHVAVNTHKMLVGVCIQYFCRSCHAARQAQACGITCCFGLLFNPSESYLIPDFLSRNLPIQAAAVQERRWPFTGISVFSFWDSRVPREIPLPSQCCSSTLSSNSYHMQVTYFFMARHRPSK